MIHPFSDTREVAVVNEKLTKLQNYTELKPKFKKLYQEFWLQKEITDCYSALWTVVKKLLVVFPIYYLMEHAFGVVPNFSFSKEIDSRLLKVVI